jgi:smad nuclear-interacting protein 1
VNAGDDDRSSRPARKKDQYRERDRGDRPRDGHERERRDRYGRGDDGRRDPPRRRSASPRRSRPHSRSRKQSRSTPPASTPAPEDKAKPNFAPSGFLAAAMNTVKNTDGTSTLLKYNEPPEARKPLVGWRLYVFKGEEQVGASLLHFTLYFYIPRLLLTRPFHALLGFAL